jgi:galactosylgalactosylxylosylprotein 3-beta-glucuronosyltransferase 3
VEDAPSKTPLVANLLSRSLLNFTHLSAETPGKWKFANNRPNWKKPRGVEQRNAALDWLRETRTMHDHGVVYFADDDNTYHTQLFEEVGSSEAMLNLEVIVKIYH